MRKLIQPALTDAEWHRRRSGGVHVLIDRLDRQREGDARLLPLAAALHDKLAALLPPR